MDRNSQPGLSPGNANQWQANDFNGDGVSDLESLCLDFEQNELVLAPAYINYNRASSGDLINVGSFTDGTIINNNLKMFPCDFNGDGINDMCLILDNTLYTIIINPNEKKNNLKCSANGLNYKNKFTYSTLADNNIYHKSTSLSYPLLTTSCPIGVVSSISNENGVLGYSSISYEYEDALIHLQGKGFLGFKGIKSTDNSNGFIQKSTSSLDESHYFLIPTYSSTEYPADTKLNESSMSCSLQNIYQAPSKVYFPYYNTITALNHISKTKGINETTYDQYANLTTTSSYYYPSLANSDYVAFEENSSTGYQSLDAWCPSKPSDIERIVYRENNPDANSTIANIPITAKKHFEYNLDGTLESEIDFYQETNAIKTKYSEYHAGQSSKKQVYLASIQNPSPEQIKESTINYDANYRYPESVSNFLGHVSTATYNPAFGNKLSTTDPNQLTVTNMFDGFGRLFKSTNPEGVWVETDLKWYTGTDKPNVVYYSETTSNNGPKSQKYYDKLGRVLYTADENPEGLMACTRTNYNAKGLITSVSEPYFENSSPTQSTTKDYDNYNRLWHITLPTQVVLTYTYYAPLPQSTGFTTSIYNSGTSITTSRTADVTGKCTSATDPAGTIIYDYYSDGQPKSIQSPDGSIVSMEYDEYGNQTKLSDPDAGDISYEYNEWGELKKQTDANLLYFQMTYDKLGRLLTKSSSNNTFNITNVYDTQPHGIGLLSETRLDNGYKVSFMYDDKCRVVNKTEHYDKDFVYLYTYDTKGNLDEYTFPSGYTIKYLYDNSNGSLDRVIDKVTNRTIYVPEAHNVRGQLCDYSNSNGNIHSKIDYDAYGMPASVKVGTTANGYDLQFLETHFNQYSGNLEYRKDNNQNLIENFTYDLVFKNRLASWQVSGQPEYNMTYTTNGNVETKSDFTSSGNPYNYDINDKPHAVKSVTDPLQLPAEALQHISYNILNNVSEINHNEQGLRYTISYGPDEQRVKSQYWVNNVIQKTKYYIGGDYEEEINSIGETRKLHYLPGGGLYVKNQASNGVMYYVLTDYQGSWCKVVTETGASMERYNFDPWGRRRNPDNWNIYYVPASYTFDRGYTGHEMLDAFGLINMNGRVYDPIVARFLSPDNYVLSIDNSQGFNRYSYCYNNPLKFTDPSGNFVIVDSWLIGFVHGFFSTGSGRWSAAWNSANHRAGNDARIWGGLFASDPNKKFFGRVWEVLSRLTWQAPQTVLGFLYNQSVNTFTSRVEDVDYFHGATYVVGATRGGNAVTLGSYISISPISDDEQAHIRIGEGGYTTMHEYGHYLQSKKSGPLFLYKYGIPSALGDADWTEIDANTRSAAYFHKIDASFDWVQVPGDRYRMLADRVYNPRWFEYPLFITAIGIPFIAAKNWTEPW